MSITARIDAVKAAFRAAVAGTVPIIDPSARFVSVLDAFSGRMEPLEKLQEGQRWFEVVAASLPVDAPGACRDLVTFHVRIRYERTGDRDPVETLILEDVRALKCELRKGANWNQAATGLTAVDVEQPIIENFPNDDAAQFSIVAVPLLTRIRSC